LEKRGINLKVDLKHPDKTLNIEILHHAFVLLKKYNGVSGLPCGVEGKIFVDMRQAKDNDDIHNLLLCSFLLIRRGVMPIMLVNNFSNPPSEQIKKVINTISLMAGGEVDIVTNEQYEKNEKMYSKMLIAECSDNPRDLNLFDKEPWRFVFPLITDDYFKDKMKNLMRELFNELQ
jgi:adenylyl- and sulfurtransferase ThiI